MILEESEKYKENNVAIAAAAVPQWQSEELAFLKAQLKLYRVGQKTGPQTRDHNSVKS